MKKYLRVIIIITAISILSGCAARTIPLMKLQNNYNPDVTNFESLGTITIEEFEDKRPSDEKIKNQKFQSNWQVWSGETEPQLIDFFSTIVNRECEKSGIFSLSSSGEYELRGKINSLKVMRRVGIMQTIAGYMTIGAVAVVYVNPISAILIDVVAIGMITASTSPVVASIDFEAQLFKDNSLVWEGNIRKKIKGSNWSSSPESISKKGSLIIDKLLTLSAKKMLSEINKNSTKGLKQ